MNLANNINAYKANNNNNHSKVKRVGIYARVSTNHQNLDVQLTELRAVAKQRGWTIVNEYLDEGVSGSCVDRDGLNKLMQDSRSGKLDIVLIWRLDRLGRSLQHVLSLLDELSNINVGFLSLKDNGIDSTSPSGRLLIQLLGAFAEFERNVIVSRVRAGLKRAQEKGVHCGRPRVDVDVRPAVALLKEGRSLNETSSILGISRNTLRRRLQDSDEWPINATRVLVQKTSQIQIANSL